MDYFNDRQTMDFFNDLDIFGSLEGVPAEGERDDADNRQDPVVQTGTPVST